MFAEYTSCILRLSHWQGWLVFEQGQPKGFECCFSRQVDTIFIALSIIHQGNEIIEKYCLSTDKCVTKYKKKCINNLNRKNKIYNICKFTMFTYNRKKR